MLRGLGHSSPIPIVPTTDQALRRRVGWLIALALAALVAIGNLQTWQLLHRPLDAPGHAGAIAGLAYNAFQRWDDPIGRRYPTDDQIDGDLAILSRYTDRVRTYSSGELPALPGIAARYGLRVTAGVWLDGRPATDRLELEAVKHAARDYDNIERVIAGNESLLRENFTPEQLMAHLDELRRSLPVPVSTAEPWHVWLKHPELARHVDFITVHLLPYWEGVPVEAALDYAMGRLDEIRRTFPNKHVVIGEIGWPSQGDRRDGATASPEAQARFIREFLSRVRGQGVDYFLMEAVDQPWKSAHEGRVGAYWGIFHADRTPKFELAGPIQPDARWSDKALAASLLAFVPMLWFAGAFARWRLASRLAFCVLIQAVASLTIWLVALPFDYYLRTIDWLALAALLPALGAMVAILLANGFEFAEMFWRGNLRRTFGPRPLPDGAAQPFVSVHLACCNEPPEMVIATLDSLAALDYERFEVLVIDNNTRDEALWRPVERHVAQLGERFRFFHLPKWPGFKAGALNFALTQTDPRAEVVGVVDADYVVRRNWLRDLVGGFADERVAVVQAPQAHRDWTAQPLKRMMNWEFDGFFRIGMHHRNERDAIIQHGTMTLIRAEALREHGRWSEWCICEDTELGLRLMKAGYSTVYVDRVMGEGLVPDDFASFGRQRRRWAFGAMQILKAHWKSLLRPGELTGAQRYHFVAGWLSWFGDALHLVFAFAAMAWTVGMLAAPDVFSLPITLFMAPLLVFFACKALFGPLLYLRRVPCGLADVLGAALAGVGLSHSIARGVFAGLSQRRGVFEVTRKGAGARRAPGVLDAVREESMLLLGLLVCIGGVALTRLPGHFESALWMGVLTLQALPYAASLACAALAHWPARRARGAAAAQPGSAREAAAAGAAGLAGSTDVPALARVAVSSGTAGARAVAPALAANPLASAAASLPARAGTVGMLASVSSKEALR